MSEKQELNRLPEEQLDTVSGGRREDRTGRTALTDILPCGTVPEPAPYKDENPDPPTYSL